MQDKIPLAPLPPNLPVSPPATPSAPAPKITSGPLQVSMKAFIRDRDRLLVIRDKPAPEVDHWSDLWEVPGGRIRFGEEPKAVLRRKVEEEIGVAASHFKIYFPVFVTAFLNPAGAFIVMVGWHCNLLPGAKITLGEHTAEWQWANQKALLKLPFGVLQDKICRDYWRYAEMVGISPTTGFPTNIKLFSEDWPKR